MAYISIEAGNIVALAIEQSNMIKKRYLNDGCKYGIEVLVNTEYDSAIIVAKDSVCRSKTKHMKMDLHAI